MTAAFWDDEPTNEHTLACAIWTTNDQPCDCRDLPRLTTAQLLDQLCPVTDLEDAS
jgi:hypothetical protein